MGATLTQIQPMLKEHYHDTIVDNFFTTDKTTAPLLASLEAKSMSEQGFGRGYVIPTQYGMGSAVSATFATAQSKAQGTSVGSTSPRDRWVVQAVTIEGFCYWARDAMLAAQGKGADELFDLVTAEMDARIAAMKKRIAHSCNEKGFGRVGTIVAAPTSTTITIGVDEVNRLQIGDELVASSAESGAALRATANTGNRVTGYNPDTGVVNVATDPTGGGGAWQNGDVVFFSGDRQDTGSPVEIMPFGLPAWVPVSAPGSTTFCGINRQNVPELGGLRYALSGGVGIAAGLIRGANRLFQYGSKPSLCLVSPQDYGTLAVDKDQVKTVELKVGKYEIGFDGISVRTNAGLVPVVPEAMCEQGNAWMGPFDNKKFAPFLAHNDDLINIDDADGNMFRAAASAAAYEMRLYFRGNIALPAPGKFLVVTGLPTA